MIDRKILAIGGGFIAVMLIGALWRVSMLQAWATLPRFSDSGAPLPPGSTMRFLQGPLILGFFTLVAGFSFRQRPVPHQQWKPWREHGAAIVLGLGVIFTLLQVYFIARSFGGAFILGSEAVFRAVMVFFGIAFLASSNVIPKLPLVQAPQCFSDFGADNGAKLLRYYGYSGVLLGLVFIAAAVAAPHDVFMMVAWSVIIAHNAGGILFRRSLRRSQPQ